MAIHEHNHVPDADKEYMLPRDGRETIRLTAQHYLLINRQGWILHPDVEKAIENIPHPKIIDLATGNGTWAFDIAQKLSNSSVCGLDISKAQFPAKAIRPSNLELDTYDLLQDVPDEHRGKYDVVHVRLLLCAGPSADKSVFIECFEEFLKPGGWLQWDELSYPLVFNVHIDANYPNGLHQKASAEYPIMRVTQKSLRAKERLGWMDDFETTFHDAGGWGIVKKVNIPIRPHLLKIETDLLIAALTDMMETVVRVKKIKDHSDLAEISQAVQQMREDCDSGSMLAYNWVCGVAQKC